MRKTVFCVGGVFCLAIAGCGAEPSTYSYSSAPVANVPPYEYTPSTYSQEMGEPQAIENEDIKKINTTSNNIDSCIKEKKYDSAIEIFKKTVLYAASLDIGNMGYGKLGRMTPQEIVQQTNNYYREKEKADEMFKKISPYANFGKKPSLAETKILVKAYFDVRLKDPSSARITYSNKWLKSYALHNGKVIFCWEMSGAVNTKNSFGAYVGNKQFIVKSTAKDFFDINYD